MLPLATPTRLRPSQLLLEALSECLQHRHRQGDRETRAGYLPALSVYSRVNSLLQVVCSARLWVVKCASS